MTARLFAMVTWAAAAASAVFWGYRVFVKPLPVPPQATVAAPAVPAAGGDLTRLFGAPAPVEVAEDAAVPADARFKLVGVVAPGVGQRAGLALISVDGKAARAVGVGGIVDGDLAVVSVSHRRVELGPRSGGAAMALELPVLPEASRGSLPGATMSGATAVPPMPAPTMVPPGGFPIRPPTVTPGRAAAPGLPGAVTPNAAPGMAPQVGAPATPAAPFGVTPQPQPQPPAGGGPATS